MSDPGAQQHFSPIMLSIDAYFSSIKHNDTPLVRYSLPYIFAHYSRMV